MTFHCGLILFLWVLMMSSFFSCVNWPLAYLLWWKVYTNLLAIFFFNWVVVFLFWILRLLYLFWIQFLCLIYELQIFFPNLWFPFVFLTVSLEDQTFLTFMRSNSSLFILLHCMFFCSRISMFGMCARTCTYAYTVLHAVPSSAV